MIGPVGDMEYDKHRQGRCAKQCGMSALYREVTSN
jgi:hypothetical protein